MLHITKNEHIAINGLESSDCPVETFTQFLPLQSFGWNFAPIGQVDRDIVAFVAFNAGVDRP